MDPVVISVVIASTLIHLKMQHGHVRRGATMLNYVWEKLFQGVKLQQLLVLLPSPKPS